MFFIQFSKKIASKFLFDENFDFELGIQGDASSSAGTPANHTPADLEDDCDDDFREQGEGGDAVDSSRARSSRPRGGGAANGATNSGQRIQNISSHQGARARDANGSGEGRQRSRSPRRDDRELKKNLASKIFGYLARCEFLLKLRW